MKPAYLILGDDRPKVELALHRLRERIVQESGTELNVDEFVAGHHSASEVVSAANTLAFLGGIRLVLVHGVDAWKKADKDILVAYLRSPAPDACLALVAEKLPPTDPLRKRRVGGRRRARVQRAQVGAVARLGGEAGETAGGLAGAA